MQQQRVNGGSMASGVNGSSAASLFSYVGTSTANFIRDSSGEKASANNTNNAKQGGWRGSEDILKLLPGQSFDIKQTVEYGAETNAAMARAKRHGLQHGKTTIIFFLGGCTHTEVSAVRFLAQHDEGEFMSQTNVHISLQC